MTTHQHNPNREPDENFFPGELAFLHKGNFSRLLDARRTPGKIVAIDLQGGFFHWEILDFEDKGKHWEVPLEQVENYQFAQDSQKASASQVAEFRDCIARVDQELVLEVEEEAFQRTCAKIATWQQQAEQWLSRCSRFLASGGKMDWQSVRGPSLLQQDLLRYCKEHGIGEQEEETARLHVMNPESGEWMKGMAIVLAKLGIQHYQGKAPRSEQVFQGKGSKELRATYLLRRLAFVRAYFHLLGIHEVVLFRGVASETDKHKKRQKAYSCWTFQRKIAEEFCDFEVASRFRYSCLLKQTFPVGALWMTYLETQAMNQQYLEAEALVLEAPHAHQFIVSPLPSQGD